MGAEAKRRTGTSRTDKGHVAAAGMTPQVGGHLPGKRREPRRALKKGCIKKQKTKPLPPRAVKDMSR